MESYTELSEVMEQLGKVRKLVRSGAFLDRIDAAVVGVQLWVKAQQSRELHAADHDFVSRAGYVQ